MQTNVWIIQSKQPDKFTAPIKKGLKACLQWKVHLAYPASLQELHSNTKKQLFGLQVRRADHLATLPALILLVQSFAVKLKFAIIVNLSFFFSEQPFFRKISDIRFPCEHCNLSCGCLPVKMASKP